EKQFGNAMPSDLLNAAFDQIEAIRADMIELTASRPRTAGDIGVDVLTAAEERARGGGMRAPSTGLPDLDAKLPMRGLAPGSLLVIGGRTGMGKSMLLSSMARQAAKNCGVAFFSLEVGADEMSARMMVDIAGNGPSYEEVLSGDLDNDRLEAMHLARRELERLPIMIDPRAGLNLGDIERSAASFADHIAKRDIRLGLLVIDHAQIVRASNRYQGNRVGELGEIANGAKVIAKRLGCCVALASQINRSVEKNGDESKRPTIADLRGSGEIEEAADCIGLLYRPAYYIERSAKFKEGDPAAEDELHRVRNDLEMAIDKSRQGRTGNVRLWCDPARSIVRCRTPFESHAGARQ
ncbi:replicative DNA helicase, partial [Camelimonas fluminis]